VEKSFPSRAAIEAFGNGGFRFAGMSHQGSLLILPSGMRAWSPMNTATMTTGDFRCVLAEKDAIDFLLVGTGATMQRLPKDVSVHLTAREIRFDCMTTNAAISTYNVMLGENRRVAAALVAVA
jgi:uncharacterized protein